VGNQKTTLTMHAAPTTFFLTLALQTPTTWNESSQITDQWGWHWGCLRARWNNSVRSNICSTFWFIVSLLVMFNSNANVGCLRTDLGV
jgi:hypothetical protein